MFYRNYVLLRDTTWLCVVSTDMTLRYNVGRVVVSKLSFVCVCYFVAIILTSDSIDSVTLLVRLTGTYTQRHTHTRRLLDD